MDSDIMFWLGAAVVAAVIEGVTASMVSLWFAAGAVALAVDAEVLAVAFLADAGVAVAFFGVVFAAGFLAAAVLFFWSVPCVPAGFLISAINVSFLTGERDTMRSHSILEKCPCLSCSGK